MRKYKSKGIINTLLFIIMTIGLLVIGPSVKAVEGDTEGSTADQQGGCGSKDSCWIFYGTKALSGIRVTVVDGKGNMVSAKSMDYISAENFTNYVNSKKDYYRCTNSVNNKLAYLKSPTDPNSASCDWNKNDGKTTVAKYLSWLPNIYAQDDAATVIKNRITNMDKETLENTFFNDIGYDVNKNGNNLENHYLIIEPLTLVALGTYKAEEGDYSGSHYNYYGTYHELAPKILERNWVETLGTSYLPMSIFSVGNTGIGGTGGYNSSDGTYFSGLMKVVVKDIHYRYREDKKRNQLYNNYLFTKDPTIGFGLGIYWLKSFENIEPNKTCDYNNSSHFNNTTSGPNGEDCCEYVLNNLSQYGINQTELFSKYPRCNSIRGNNCTFSLSTTTPSCGNSSYGSIKDIGNWGCIYASAYSNNQTIKNYFLKYGGISSDCSVYCRNELSYYYPDNNMTALAGNYFTIGSSLNSYNSYLDPLTNTTKINAATLGPVQVSVTKQCRISGNTNNKTCQDKAKQELAGINAPTISFAYESSYYKNPVEELSYTISKDDSKQSSNTYSRTVTYSYSLPSTTYKYVSKNTGISYKNTSAIGKYPYITIEPHLPIHFSQRSSTTDYKLTIKKFNLENFDNLIINGYSISSGFKSTIETYIKTMLDENYSQWFTSINGITYLNNRFTNILKNNGYESIQVLGMGCANTDKYSCHYDTAKGLYYCYDKNTNTNSSRTYDNFRTCINSAVSQINYNKKNYKSNMQYFCYFNVDNASTPSGIDVIYRQISLDNPFPNDDGKGRDTGANWCYDYDCGNNNTTVETYITNNRGVQTEEIYKDLDPLYKIVLTPSIIKEIRKYNDATSYDDFNFVCDSNGENCKSNFIRNSLSNGKYNFSNYFSGCGIASKSTGLNCQTNDKW